VYTGSAVILFFVNALPTSHDSVKEIAFTDLVTSRKVSAPLIFVDITK